MEKGHDDELKVIISLNDQLFSIPAHYVSTMDVVKTVREVPHSPPYIRGLINIRGDVLQLVDLRVKLGYGSIVNENNKISKFIEKQKEEHNNWLNKLEESINNDSEFDLIKNPAECEWGKWSNEYSTENSILARTLNDINTSHATLHQIADQASNLAKIGKKNQAINLIKENRKTTLSRIIHLFENASKILKENSHEILIVVELENKRFALAVENINSIERLDKFESENSMRELNSEAKKLINGIGKLPKKEETILNIDLSKVMV